MREELREGPSAPPSAGHGGVGEGTLPLSDELRAAVEGARSGLHTSPPPVEAARSEGAVETAVAAPAEAAGRSESIPERLDFHLETASVPGLAAATGAEEPRSAPAENAPLEFHLEPAVQTPAPTPGYIPVELTPTPQASELPALDAAASLPSAISERSNLEKLRAVPFKPPEALPALGRRWWRRGRADAHPPPETTDLKEPLFDAPVAPTARAEPDRPKLTHRERRWLRRRRRIVFEEVLGWILVPVILIASYWLVKFLLNALGTSPTALIEGIKQAVQGLDRR